MDEVGGGMRLEAGFGKGDGAACRRLGFVAGLYRNLHGVLLEQSDRPDDVAGSGQGGV